MNTAYIKYPSSWPIRSRTATWLRFFSSYQINIRLCRKMQLVLPTWRRCWRVLRRLPIIFCRCGAPVGSATKGALFLSIRHRPEESNCGGSEIPSPTAATQRTSFCRDLTNVFRDRSFEKRMTYEPKQESLARQVSDLTRQKAPCGLHIMRNQYLIVRSWDTWKISDAISWPSSFDFAF